jgi:hypothetical protein
MTNNYHRHLPKLKYNQSVFDELTSYALTTDDWNAGYDKRGFRFNLEYIRLDTAQFPVLQEIYNCWNCEFKKPNFILSKVLPGGLIMHHDFAKTGNLAFPLHGDFSNTPQWYFDFQSNITEEFYYQGSPVLFNTQILHAVPLSEQETEPRILLMMNQYEWMPDLFSRIDNGSIWIDSENFHYENS